MGKTTRSEKKALKKQQSLLEVKDVCVNCDMHIALDQRFCAHCGGKRIYNKLTWRNLFEDFIDRFLNLENSFLKTFIAMFRQPEDVIGGYMHGMRKKYLPAFSYFAIAITFTGFYYFLLKGWFMDTFIAAQASVYDDSVSQAQKELQKEITNLFMENQSLYMFLIIPFLALISKIVFWNYKKYNLVEHFVIFLYTYSHISIISVTFQIAFIWSATILEYLSVALILFMFIFTIYVLKRLFDLDGAKVLLKTLLFFIVFSILSCVMSIPIVVVGFMSAVKIDDNDQMDVDESTFLGKFVKFSREEAQHKKTIDSLEKDSLKRLENTLEITPEMIKNRPQ